MGSVVEAEIEIAHALETDPDCLDAISLLAKIKHIKGELTQTIACWALIHARSVQQRAGFEQDLEQLAGLLRVHDQLGSPETLDAAARICWHVLGELERAGIENLSVLGQLAALERRRGGAIAASLEARFLESMRRRMHRPTLHDVVRIAATEYLPIAKLRDLRPAGDALPLDLPRREQALVRALQDEPQSARILLADGVEPLDRQYLAELIALEGDEPRAIELFLETLEDRPELQVIGWLLERGVRVPDRAFAIVEANRQRAPHRADTWRWLSILHDQAGDAAEARRCSARATAFAEAARSRAMPIGRTLAASVYRLAGRAKGLLHEIWVDRERASPGCGGTLSADDIHGNLTPELRAAVRNTFIAVKQYARAKFPHATTDLEDFTYTYKLPKEDEPSGGLSAGLPSALAFLSVFLQRPIARTFASSGALVSEAHDVISIGRIGEVDYKVKAAYHGNLDSLILPLANRVDLDRSALVPLAIRNELVRYAADLDQVVKLVFGADVFTRT